MEQDDQALFILPLGSAAAVVEILPWNENETVITIRAYVATDVALSPDLMLFLLQQNAQIPFGAFSVDEAGDIRFEHALVGSTCDPLELTTAVKAVLEVADTYDDKITQTWGGATVDRSCRVNQGEMSRAVAGNGLEPNPAVGATGDEARKFSNFPGGCLEDGSADRFQALRMAIAN